MPRSPASGGRTGSYKARSPSIGYSQSAEHSQEIGTASSPPRQAF